VILELYDTAKRGGVDVPVFGNFDPALPFVSAMPDLDVMREALATDTVGSLLPAGIPASAANMLKTPAQKLAAVLGAAQIENVVESARHTVFGVSNVTGVISDRVLAEIPDLYNQIADKLGAFEDLLGFMAAPNKGPDYGRQLMQHLGIAVLDAMSAIPVYGTIIQSVVRSGVMIYQSVQAQKDSVGDYSEGPMTTYVSPALDEEQVNTALSYLASWDRDITSLFAPKYEGRWTMKPIGSVKYGEGRLARDTFRWPAWGFAFAQGEEGEFWDIPGHMGFMPGTRKILGRLEWTAPNRLIDGLGQQANWWKIRANYQNRTCWEDEEHWTGYRKGELYDCKRNVPRGAISGDALGRTQKDKFYTNKKKRDYETGSLDTITNVGDFFTATRSALGGLWGDVLKPSPLMYSVSTESLYYAWKSSFEQLFEDAPQLWSMYRGHGHRYALAHLLSYFLVGRHDGRFGGVGTVMDWRENWDTAVETLRGNFAGSHATYWLWANTIFARGIEPILKDLADRQLRYYRSTMVAYLWERQGAHWNADTGKLRDDIFGEAFAQNRQWLLTSGRRFMVRMEDVVDEDFRQALIESGVDPQNDPEPGFRVTGVVLDPADAPLLDLAGEPIDDPTAPDPIGGLPGLPLASMKRKPRTRGGLGAGAAVAAVAALALVAKGK
jgi:hypothetical protein